MLANWLKQLFEDVVPEMRPAFVGTIHSWLLQVANSAGAKIRPGIDELDEFYKKELPLLALEALDLSPVSYDKIVIDELKTNNEYDKIYQHFTINVPYACSKNSCSIVLRPIISENVVTAKFAKLSTKTLNNIVEKIQKLDFVDALYYDITNNTPISFGWE